MREHKYRAWDKENNEMLYDYDQSIKGLKIGDSIHAKVWQTGLLYETLMQYTGFKDKNGKDIYEGDILKDCEETNRFYLISLTNGSSSYDLIMRWGLLSSISNMNAMPVEIIGNIYENPELL